MKDDEPVEHEEGTQRVLDGLRALLSLRPGREERAEAGLQGTSERVGALLRRRARVGKLLKRFGDEAADRLVAPGQWMSLSVRPRGLGGAVARRVRFLLDGKPLGTAPVEPNGKAHLAVQAPDVPGVYSLARELLGPGEARLGQGPKVCGHVHVVAATTPLLLLEAAWASEASDEQVRWVRRLHAEGLAVAYVGLGERSSAHRLRERVEREYLPEGAWLPFGEEDADAFERELLGAFVLLAVRRLRAEGFGQVGLVATHHGVLRTLRAEGVPCWEPRDLSSVREGWSMPFGGGGLASEEREEVVRRLEAMTGAEAVAAWDVCLTIDNAEARCEVLRAISEARHEVLLQSYIVEDGRVADAFAAALIGAARRGVRVRVLVDALYARHRLGPLRNPVLEALDAEAGIEVRAVDPPLAGDELDPLRFKARDHRKLLVVDGEVAFVGGRNIGDAYYTGFEEVAVADFTPHERVPWFDAHARLRGPVVVDVRSAFLEGWSRALGTGEAFEALAAERAEAEASRVAAVWDETRGGPRASEQRSDMVPAWFVAHEGLGDARALGAYEALFDGARERLLVLNDFPIVDALEAALRRAMARGVRVTFLTGSAVARRGDGSFLQGPLHRELFEYMTKHRFEALVRAGADVREAVFRGERVVCRGEAVRPYVHAKLVVVDGRWISVGSANLDATASYWEREAVVVMDAPHLASRLEEELGHWLVEARRIRLDDPLWRREAPLRRLADAVWPQALYS